MESLVWLGLNGKLKEAKMASLLIDWLVEWGFYALSASKAIFRARTYSPVMMMNETRRKPTTGRLLTTD